MTMKRNNAGFGVVEIILVAVVVAIIGLIGYRVWDTTMSADTETTSQQPQTTQQSVENEAPKIEKSEDLDKADSVLDDTDIEGGSEAELNEETNFQRAT